MSLFIYNQLVPKYLSPKSPSPGAKYLFEFKTGSIYAIIIFNYLNLFKIISIPYRQPIMLTTVIFSSLTPLVIITSIA
jgi:hypothetical protein